MQIDLANIETSTPSESDAELFGEGSKLALTTCTSDKIFTRFTLSNNFNTEYYLEAGLTATRFSDDADTLHGGYIYAAADANYNKNTVITSRTKALLQEYFETDSDGMYTLYGFARAKNGRYYNITSGSPIKFWYSVPSIKLVSVTQNTATIRVRNLEQIYDGTAATMGVTTSSFNDEATSIKNGIDFPAMPDRNNTITFYNLPSGRKITLYLYKRAFDGTYWLLKALTFETQSSEIPQCVLEMRFSNKKLENGIVCRNYPIITAENFNQFCADINAVRRKAGFSAVTLPTVSPNDLMTAEVWGKVHGAVKSMTTLSNAAPDIGYEITPEWLEDIETSLQQIRDEVY